MLKKALLASIGAAMFVGAAPASASTIVWVTTWEADQVPGGPTFGNYTIYNNPPTAAVAGWTPVTQIELQNHAAGDPAPVVGGEVFAELDADFNSAMTRIIGPGTYDLSFLYSPRPGVGFDSNGILVELNGVELGQISATGLSGGSTAWSNIVMQTFTVGSNATLRFSANGTSDSLGGYIDNITLAAVVPEPSTWALFILGFGLVGHSMRRRSQKVRVSKAALNFA
jgi:hypothetical protein